MFLLGFTHGRSEVLDPLHIFISIDTVSFTECFF
jgi:hypothetical protein